MAKDDYDIEKILSEIDHDENEDDLYKNVPPEENGFKSFNDKSSFELDAPFEITKDENEFTFNKEDLGTQEEGGDGFGDEADRGGNEKTLEQSQNEIIESVKTEESRTDVQEYPKYTLVGTKTWNRKEPYIISVDLHQLQVDREHLEKTFHIILQPDSNNTIKDDIRSSLARFMRKSGPGMVNEYENFIFTTINSINNELISYFKFGEDLKSLFFYHLGPLSIYKIISEKFNKMKYGDCFRYESQTGKGMRYLPEEFIKEKILQWYENNINSLSINFDSIQYYDRIVKTITQSYNIVKRNFLVRLDKLNNQLNPGKQITSKELIRLKGDKWFGIQNIVTYKRFIEKNILN